MGPFFKLLFSWPIYFSPKIHSQQERHIVITKGIETPGIIQKVSQGSCTASRKSCNNYKILVLFLYFLPEHSFFQPEQRSRNVIIVQNHSVQKFCPSGIILSFSEHWINKKNSAAQDHAQNNGEYLFHGYSQIAASFVLRSVPVSRSP